MHACVDDTPEIQKRMLPHTFFKISVQWLCVGFVREKDKGSEVSNFLACCPVKTL